jgi:hypothetical protein
MSSYTRRTKNPISGKFELAWWIDDFFGKHLYGVKFPDGTVFRESEHEWEFGDPEPEPPLAA